MNWSNNITQLLGIEYPIIQAPMFGVTTPEMVAAAAKANTLGSLSLADLPTDKCIDLIRKTKQLTDKPFAVNIFLHTIPELSDSLRKHYNETKSFLENLAKEYGLQVALPEIDHIHLADYHDQVDAIIAEKCKIVSFTFGNLDAESIQKLKSHNVILIGTCTSVEEAKILEESGIDLICVQGIEAGGHRGSFMDQVIPQIGGFSLLPQVFEQVKTPLIYAGGIYNARTLLAAKTLGAQGFQIGSLLLNSSESALLDFEKEELRNLLEKDIILTKSFSGRFARGIQNTFIRKVEHSGYILPYPYQNKLTGELRKAARTQSNSNFVNIWTGQSITPLSEASTSEILQKLIKETEQFNHEI